MRLSDLFSSLLAFVVFLGAAWQLFDTEIPRFFFTGNPKALAFRRHGGNGAVLILKPLPDRCA